MKDKKCPLCTGKMIQIKDSIKEDNVEFEAYKCNKCGEELLDMQQLKGLATKYRGLRKAKAITFAKWGNSIAVRIPVHIAEQFHLKPGKQGIINSDEEGIKITV